MTDFKPVEIIQALAGSGKTQLLAYRFIRLMKLGADPTTILATTFSRKAAGEIRDRIIEMLSEAILTEDGFEKLVSGVPELSSNIEIGRRECTILLQELVSIIHRLNIGTIDSFFVKTAVAFSDTLELTQGWTILDEVNEDQVFSDAIHRLIQTTNNSKHLATVLRQSKSGAKVPIYNTIAEIKKQAYIAARSSNESVWVWNELIPTLSSEEVDQAIAGLANLELENGRQITAVKKAIENLQNKDWKSFLVTGIAPAIINGSLKYYKSDLENGIAEAYQPLITHGFNVMANRLLVKNKSTYALMSELHASLIEAKHHQGYYSFDDVTFQLSNSEIMEQLSEMRFRMDGSIDHILVDEFQDTSLPQWKVLEPLVQEINQSTNDRSLFIVGDVKQSLYSFRGGEPALLRGLDGELIHATTTRLDASWRCTPPILDAVNTVFSNVKNAPLLTDHSLKGVNIWSEDFKRHVSAAPIQQFKGYAEVQSAGSSPQTTSLQSCVDKVVEVVSMIHTKAPAATIGVLVRSNTKQQIQIIVHALRTCKDAVLASEFGGNSLTDSPAVTLILSALLMADDQSNSIHTFHVATSPLGTYLNLSYPCDSETLNQVSKTIRNDLLKEGYANVIHTLAEQLVEHVDTRERIRLWQLVEFAESYAAEKTLRPAEFVRVVKEGTIADPASSQVQVMTIHKSKGLSFDAVVVCDLDQAIWKAPEIMESHNDNCEDPTKIGMYASEYIDEILPEYAEMREETCQNQVSDAVCLLYVAMTRAKRAMHIIVPCRETATKHHKKLDGLLLQLLGKKQQQESDSSIWIAEGSDRAWVDDFKMDSPEIQKKIKPFTIQSPTHEASIKSGIACSSPSSLEGGGEVLINERFSGQTNVGLYIGTITHKWFEDIEWLDEMPSIESLTDSAPIVEAKRVGETKLHDAAERCLNSLSSTDIKELLTKPTGNVVVYREQEFALQVDQNVRFADVIMKEPTDLYGSIDRLVVYKDREGAILKAEVIDWKTDSIKQGELPKKISHYAPQLSSYRFAASKLLGIDIERITAKLVFTSIGKAVDITDKT